MKRVFALLVLAVGLAGGCGGDDDAAAPTPPGGTSPTTTMASSTLREPKPENPAVPNQAPHAAPESVLRRMRRIEDRYSRPDERFAEALRAVSGFDSDVRCWTPRGWRKVETINGMDLGGLTDVYAVEIHLHPYICQWLDALVAGQRPDSGPDARHAAASLVALTHEGTHLTSAGGNEAVVECRAMQNAHKVAERLGIEEAYARTLMGLYWEELYPRDDPRYGSEECRDGGALDVNPDTSAWP
jgi:hypothetical protein